MNWSREATFLAKLRVAAPGSASKDLDPIINPLRAVKSPRESAVIREAIRIAGEAIMAAMREARVGLHEYELQAPAEGDLVQFDYAPDFKYCQSDVTRVCPANGKFTPRQCEIYEIHLKLYQSVLSSIQVHKTPADCVKDALVKMDAIMASHQFTDPRIKAAAVFRPPRSNRAACYPDH